MVEGKAAARLAAEQAEQREHRVARSAELAHERLPAVKHYRREKRRYDKHVASQIVAAKLEMARLDELNRLAHRGGRPKKVVARG